MPLFFCFKYGSGPLVSMEQMSLIAFGCLATLKTGHILEPIIV
ncbi:unnamed protein product [Brassica rapa subsp. narinosa]